MQNKLQQNINNLKCPQLPLDNLWIHFLPLTFLTNLQKKDI